MQLHIFFTLLHSSCKVVCIIFVILARKIVLSVFMLQMFLSIVCSIKVWSQFSRFSMQLKQHFVRLHTVVFIWLQCSYDSSVHMTPYGCVLLNLKYYLTYLEITLIFLAKFHAAEISLLCAQSRHRGFCAGLDYSNADWPLDRSAALVGKSLDWSAAALVGKSQLYERPLNFIYLEFILDSFSALWDRYFVSGLWLVACPLCNHLAAIFTSHL